MQSRLGSKRQMVLSFALNVFIYGCTTIIPKGAVWEQRGILVEK